MFVLGVLIFVHELGHFLAAKRVGIRVVKFQLGFNPTVVSFRRGDTEYGIGAVPLGGYVKMAGENPDEARAGRTDEFLSKSKWERFQVLIMGPAMNVLLAVVLTAVILYQGAEVPVYQDQPPVVGAVTAQSPASQADIQPGDRILSVAGRVVATWEDFFIAIGTRPNREIAITLVRSGTELSRRVTPIPSPDSRFEIGDIGVLPDVHPRVPRVNHGEPADLAGIRPGDVILAVDDERITFPSQLTEAIASSRPGETITIAVLRDGVRRDIAVTPARGGCTGVASGVACIGIAIAGVTKSIQPGRARSDRYERRAEPADDGADPGDTVASLHAPDLASAVDGPGGYRAALGRVGPAWVDRASQPHGQHQPEPGLAQPAPRFPCSTAATSSSWGLKGWRAATSACEAKEKMLLAGFVMLVMLMVTAIYNDLTRIAWIERLMPWR